MLKNDLKIADYITALNEEGTLSAYLARINGGAPDMTLGVPISGVRKVNARIRKEIADEAELVNLSKRLWKSGLTEARMLACLSFPGRLAQKALLKRWASSIRYPGLADIFVDELVMKSEWAEAMFDEWKTKNDQVQKRLAYRLLLKLSRTPNHRPDDYYIGELYTIEKQINDAAPRVAEAMNEALVGIGTRNRKLNTVARTVARRIGDLKERFRGSTIRFQDACMVLASKKVQDLLPD